MQEQRKRRAHGSGEVFAKDGTWYGRFYVRGRRVKRSLGPIRQPGTRDGLTKAQAEARLREKMVAEASAPPPVKERMTVGDVGERLIRQLTVKGRKDSTTENYASYLKVHLNPHFGDQPISEIEVEDVEDFIEACLQRKLAVKSVLNYLGFLHGIFEFAIKKHWTHHNPCKEAEYPEADDGDAEIHFLDQAELEALLQVTGTRSPHSPRTLERAAQARDLHDNQQLSWKKVAAAMGCAESTAIYLYRCDPQVTIEDDLGRVERAMYLTAAMTGLRQGELLALRWMDIDWFAHRVRVRRNYVRGKFGTPKSKRSSRSVPLADLVATELERLFQSSPYQADEDLVFGNPHTGQPFDRSVLLRRFKRSLERAGVRQVRFHDLRHTFGTRMAATGVPMRTLQEWMGHRDYKTTLIYADYAPATNEVGLVNAAFSMQSSAAAGDPAELAAADAENPHAR